jgi:peptide/nickel transport system permease protein
MLKYIIKRVLITIPILLSVILIVFFALNVIPGSPAEVMAGEKADQAAIDAITEEWRLNDPVMVRFWHYVTNVVKGDFGTSYKLRMNVSQQILNAFPNTLKLAVAGLFFAWIVGIPAGVISAVKRNTFIDHFFMGFSLFGISVPVFFSALLAQWIFGVKLGWLPVAGLSSWQHLIMPAVVVGWASTGSVTRLVRSNLLGVMRHDFIRTARAKGLPEGRVIMGHALKNSLLTVITVMALQIATMLGGAVVTESVFGIAGLGRITVDALSSRDMPMLQGAILFQTMLIVGANLIADIMYSVVDPRIRV